MEENTNAEEVLELVKKAQSKGTFDITAFAKGRAYPQDQVTAFLDLEAAYELEKLNNDMRSVTDPDALAPMEERANELAERVKASKVVFYMRGVNQAVIEKITEDCNKNFELVTDMMGNKQPSGAWILNWTTALVASNIYKIENADGEMDEREFDLDSTIELRHHLPSQVWDMLVDKMQKLTLATGYFEGLTDAGFLPKS